MGGEVRRLSGNLFCNRLFKTTMLSFFFSGQTFIILGEGGGYDMGHVLRLFTHEKSHQNLLSETINNTGSLLFDIFHRPKNV